MEEKLQNKENMTISDVAEALGVSKTTVSRAISGKGRVGATTRNKVLSYIEKHNYKPSTVAKGLAQSRTYNICVTIPSDCGVSEQLFFQSVVAGMCNYLALRDYDVVVASISDMDISNLKRIVSNHKVDGVIVSRTYRNGIIVEYLKESHIPFVTLGLCNDKEVAQIDCDHREGCKELTSLLLMRGMKKIGLIGGDTRHMVTQSRYQGYLDAFKELGLEADQQLIYENSITAVLVENAVEELMVQQADCILCMDDSICNFVLHKCSHDGIIIPEDLKVASFFNSSILENHRPAITCLNFDNNEEGVIAAKTILDLLDGKEVPNVKKLGYQVIINNSTK
ncbi:LacI family DNA-binding transcriptional regulator [[Clostridium] polysaccharolyticum]|uniref:Transcriptional regulator, LacI family n=1 Tax=[Clostridium] polysaccharolyticum TaxID=29364 RepID=A0A1I0DEN9_9FIRM|nr:LacI family DNA-binding transcriptional regulator [[Clostridium] polysaccharolyticum]SET30493.1 transcriptional regulator, LacI family [[Clostridium] polysaccharolyticum]